MRRRRSGSGGVKRGRAVPQVKSRQGPSPRSAPGQAREGSQQERPGDRRHICPSLAECSVAGGAQEAPREFERSDRLIGDRNPVLFVRSRKHRGSGRQAVVRPSRRDDDRSGRERGLGAGGTAAAGLRRQGAGNRTIPNRRRPVRSGLMRPSPGEAAAPGVEVRGEPIPRQSHHDEQERSERGKRRSNGMGHRERLEVPLYANRGNRPEPSILVKI